MDYDTWDPNALVTCPYDDAHRICVTRFQRHILKCRKNHADKDYVSCPFNATHILLRDQLSSHLGRCPNRVAIDPDIIQAQDEETGEINKLMGKVSLPEASWVSPPKSENWDLEADKFEADVAKISERARDVKDSYMEKTVFQGRRGMPDNTKSILGTMDDRPYIRMAGRGFNFEFENNESPPKRGVGRGTILKANLKTRS